MKPFFNRLYYYYFYTVLAAIFLPLYPAFYLLLKKPVRHPGAQKLRRMWSRLLLKLTLIQVKVRGEQYIDPKRTYIICGNHASNLDIALLCAGLPLYMGFMAKAELLEVPFLNIFFRTIDIPVPREDTAGSATSYKKSVLALREGKSLVIFPEGGIFPDPYFLNPFKDGAFKLAIRQKIPILPVTMPDNWKVLPDEEKAGKPGKIRLILHKPIETAHLTDADVPALCHEVYQIINNELQLYRHADR